MRRGRSKPPKPPRMVRPTPDATPDVAVPGKHCRVAMKRKYNSRAAALRAGTQRYGTTSDAYRCKACGFYHLTRWGIPQPDVEDPQIEQLANALLGTGDES